MKFAPVKDEYGPYFDLTAQDLPEISIFETHGKDSCFIAPKGKSHIFKGFKLSNNALVDVCCDIGFYPSKQTGKYIPRLTLFKSDKQFAVKEQKPKQKVIVDIDDSETAANFWKMIGFLNNFKDLVDIENFKESYSVVHRNAFIVEFDNKETASKVKDLQELFSKADFTEYEIEAILREDRKKNLKRYERLLKEPEAWKSYFEKYQSEIKGSGEEAVWHHFLKKHHWLLGLNVDLKFIRDLILEADLGVKSTDNSGSPVADFLGISDFTILVELKTPNTKIFTEQRKRTARAKTWSFSDDFIDGVSQCLSQKAEWEKNHRIKSITQDNQILDQVRYRTLDPKVIFLIGCKQTEFPETSKDVDVSTKRDTFEIFRRNNRNLDILTYDELYERAYYLVHNSFAKQ
ncbi:MAG: Shedu immune nuclease family protein [Bdellovibrionales bacterium]